MYAVINLMMLILWSLQRAFGDILEKPWKTLSDHLSLFLEHFMVDKGVGDDL